MNEMKNVRGDSKHADISFAEQIADFERLRISALTKAAEISPYIKEVTIGPNSTICFDSNDVKENGVKARATEEPESGIKPVDLQYTAVLKMYQNTLNDNLEFIFKELVDKMLVKLLEMRDHWDKQLMEYPRYIQNFQDSKAQMLKEIHDNDNFSILEEVKNIDLQCEYTNTKAIDNMNKVLEEQNKATARIISITESHTKICVYYNEICDVLQNSEYANILNDKYVHSVDKVVININNVMNSCKRGNTTDKTVKLAEDLAYSLESLKNSILNEITKIQKEDNDMKQLALKNSEIEEKKSLVKQEKEQQKAPAISEFKSITSSYKSKPLYYSMKNYSHYKELKQCLETYENSYKYLSEEPSLRKYKFDLYRATVTPVNSISSYDGVHLKDKYDKLIALLQGQKVHVTYSYVSITRHPLAFPFCISLLANKLVSQGEIVVSSKRETAFAIASVTVAMWTQFPELGKLIQANFHKRCPYLVPMFLPQKEGMSEKDFYISRGYLYENGVVEKQDEFLKRISGIFQLQCVIWIIKAPKCVNSPNPQGLKQGWQWLASFVNLKPEPGICSTLLYDFFTICGAEFLKYYGRQFKKVIKVICEDYLKLLVDIDNGGPQTRLEGLLQNILSTGHIDHPVGQIPLNAW